MKSNPCLVLIAVLMAAPAAQPATVPTMPAAAPSGQTRNHFVAERGPHHRVMASVAWITNTATGMVFARTNSYTELAVGMHRLSDGQWVESGTEIELLPGGAIARQGAHTVSFAANLNTPGAIDCTTPDGKRLRSTVIGLAYFDAATGNSVLLAQLQDSTGELLPSRNQVLYPDAFTHLQADVLYTYSPAGLQQDIILRQQPPAPSEFGLFPATTRLEVVTEFLDPPAPAITSATARSLPDQTVSFGAMRLRRGKAFLVGDESPHPVNIPVGKSWVQIQGRSLLIEEVEYPAMQRLLQTLPAPAAAEQGSVGPGALLRVSPERLLPPAKTAAAPSTNSLLLANSSSLGKGFVLDYDLSGSLTNFTFQGDTTYSVVGPVLLSGLTRVEAGSVIKFPTNVVSIEVAGDGAIQWLTAPYRPAIFTALDDDSIGTPVAGSTGVPTNYYGGIALDLSALSSPVVSNANFRFLNNALAGLGITLRNGQIIGCRSGFAVGRSQPSLYNVLVYGVNTLVDADEKDWPGDDLTAENVTARYCTTLMADPTSTIRLTNSLLACVGGWQCPFVLTNYTVILSSDAGVFETVGAGSHYLAAGSPYRNAGTADIDPDLLAALRNKTTYAPVLYSNAVFSADTSFSPQAQRDTDAPDLGYHYDPIDYFSLHSCSISNATLTLTNGVVLAYGETGVYVKEDGRLVSSGTPLQRNHLVHYTLVQEQPVNLGAPFFGISYASPIRCAHRDLARDPSIALRFTTLVLPVGADWAICNGYGPGECATFDMQDCEAFAAGASWCHGDPAGSVVTLRNNLIQYANFQVTTAGEVTACNNLFTGTTNYWVVFLNQGTAAYAQTDNAFERCVACVDGTIGHNAYLNGATNWPGAHQPTDIVTNLVWETGVLGDFYQPATSPLIDQGSRTADLAGLYHYTTQTNQLKETNSVVDIGYHRIWYSGDPDDIDGDGLTNDEELLIPVDDPNHPELEHLDPLSPDTGNTGVPDGQKDSDYDSLSNLGELRRYGSDPTTAYSFPPYVADDAAYLFTGFPAYGLALTRAWLDTPQFLTGGRIRLTLLNAQPGATWDLYYKPNWQVPRMRLLCPGMPGQTTYVVNDPNPGQEGYWTALAAEDDDDDGLSNGYESFRLYSHGRTMVDDRDSDWNGSVRQGDLIPDGWEAAYGLDPTDSAPPPGISGANGDPDDDELVNYQEFNNNQQFGNPSFDPFNYFFSEAPRPVISISSSAPEATLPGGTATFTIQRAIGFGGTLSQKLKVYYAVGGTATYGNDYTLDPAPDPSDVNRGIFSVMIEENQPSVTVTVTPNAGATSQAGLQTLAMKLIPYGLGADPQTDEPRDWLYVLDVFHQAVTLNIWNGILINLEKTTPDGYLRIKPTSSTAPLPFINVANSQRGTVARIYTGADLASDPSRVVGEYYCAPNVKDHTPGAEERGGDPSRTTVDRYGNVWVANRKEGDFNSQFNDGHGGSITEYGIVVGGTRCDQYGSPTQDGQYLRPPFIYNTCVDRDGDGYIKTSRVTFIDPQSGDPVPDLLPWSNSGNADSLGGVSTAEDEVVLRYLRVVPIAVRTIIVDPKNNLWVGSRVQASGGNGWNEFIDTGTGMQVTGWRLNFQAGGYGGVVDGYGAVWSSGQNGIPTSPALLRFLPGTSMPVTTGGQIRNTGDNYGIAVDPSTGDVWQPRNTATEVMHFRPSHCATTFPIEQNGNRGIVIDGLGNVWVGGSDDTIFHLTTSGAPVGAVPISFTPPGQQSPIKEPLGVAVDSSGLVWAICYNEANSYHGYAMRIDPARGVVPPGSDRPVGEVVEIVDLGPGSGPYNYSDMSGFVALSSTQPSGVWDHVEDAGAPDTIWTSLTMAADIPAGTRILVEVRGANAITDLPNWPFVAVGSGGETVPETTDIPTGIKGRYLEVRANLLRDFGVAGTPELRTLTVAHGDPGCELQITAHPKSKAVAPGANNVTFSVTPQVPQGMTPTYEWVKDGMVISTASQLVLNNVQFADAGRYSVRVGTQSGCTYTLESAPARLHVKGNPPELLQDLNPLATLPTALEAVATVASSNPGETPLFYQWRFNNEPIATESGSCAGTTCTASLPVAADCANAGNYSVVFWNQYGQVATKNCEVSVSGQELFVTLPPGTVYVSDPDQTVTLTATTCMGDVNSGRSCVQWYFTRNGQKTAIPGANSLAYTVPTPITCDKLGLYTVSVADRGWNAYEASATVDAQTYGASVTMASPMLHIAVGTGTWTYQWYDSLNPPSWTRIPGATSSTFTLPQAAQTTYYLGLAQRSGGGTAFVEAQYDPAPLGVTLRSAENASLDVTYTAQPSGDVWTYQWYFTPLGSAAEQFIVGANDSTYTIQPVGCTRRGTYRVELNCGGSGASSSANLGMVCSP